MAGEVSDGSCARCGTPRTGDEQFCRACDTFLSWYDAGPDPDAATAPHQEPPAAPQPTSVPPLDTPAAARPTVSAGPARLAGALAGRPTERLRPPAVSTDATEVTVAVGVPGTFPLQVRNSSSIVDSYRVTVVDPPAWLAITHGDTHLLPDEARSVQVVLTVRPGSLAVAQRLAVVVRVASEVDAGRTAELPLALVVPRSGPPATLTPHPTLVRLHDTGRGAFVLHVDNRASNHPRSYRLTASDPECAVSVAFAPPVVDVAAGAVAEVDARLTAPEPAPGTDTDRQLTMRATDETDPVAVPVTVTVRVVQTTAAALVQPPVLLRLEPSQVVVVDADSARLDLVVDNRAGVEDVVVTLRGRDPARAVGFAFDHDGFAVRAGRAVRLGMQLSAGPTPRGQSVTRPFTVVAAAGGSESEVSGTLELSSRQAAIVTAAVRLVPDHLQVSARQGTFTVEVDNRHGLEPLVVGLSGTDEFGRASFAFSPPQVTVPPGQIGRAALTVSHPKPDGGQSESRRIRVSAACGPDVVHGEAVFTQESSSHQRLWAYLVAVLGVLLVGIGTLVEVNDLGLDIPESTVRRLVDDAQSSSAPATEDIRTAVVIVSLVLVVLAFVMMLFGLVGVTGRGLRVGGVVAALFGAAAIVALQAGGVGGVGGYAVVVAGAVVAFAGGIMVRASRDSRA